MHKITIQDLKSKLDFKEIHQNFVTKINEHSLLKPKETKALKENSIFTLTGKQNSKEDNVIKNNNFLTITYTGSGFSKEVKKILTLLLKQENN